ncbi:phospholipase A2-alpha-like isoform X2 [Aristolochia californica]|uniref:phospholipase A2-alpha-like isoform X2 n=1 Tax=Aristolochia californica TaxID=171875 RepID=UPI0035D9E7FC
MSREARRQIHCSHPPPWVPTYSPNLRPLSINQGSRRTPSYMIPELFFGIDMVTGHKPLKFALVALLCVFFLPVGALNVGIQSKDASVSASKECSKACESDFCSVPPFLRYGKYCGLLYSGCPGEKPCDGLDACCRNHDACVQSKNNDYLSQACSQSFLDCIMKFKNSGGPTFKGNKCLVEEVVDVISVVMEAAILAGRLLHKP